MLDYKPVAGDDDTDREKDAGKPFGVGERLFKSRQIQVNGVVDNKLATRVIASLLALEQEDHESPITMIVNSPGGSVTDGFAIYDTMRFIGPDVRVVCTGLAASIATVILLGAPKEQRLATPNTKLLIHQPMLSGQVIGQATDLEIRTKDLLQTRERINQLLAAETGQPLERIEQDTNRDYWMTADEAVEYGLIARVVRNRSEL